RLRELPDEWPIVVHPDVISDSRPWRKLGSRICIENMDLRKKVGQRAEDLEPFMEELPEAGFCLDLAHAGQVDPSMEEARRFLDRFGPRLMQVHISRLGNVSQHLHLDPHSAENYREIGRSIPEDVPVIIESVVAEEEIEQEIARVKEVFER
ncbi:MAG: hypothetical protein R3338_12140, partial [Thermoanaerobaculia bacterium]|nr:hypothetical protein [Thermoanaerobaculia bacterium]